MQNSQMGQCGTETTVLLCGLGQHLAGELFARDRCYGLPPPRLRELRRHTGDPTKAFTSVDEVCVKTWDRLIERVADGWTGSSAALGQTCARRHRLSHGRPRHRILRGIGRIRTGFLRMAWERVGHKTSPTRLVTRYDLALVQCCHHAPYIKNSARRSWKSR